MRLIYFLSEIMDAVLSMSPNNFAGLKKTSLEIDIEEWKKRQVAIFTLQAKSIKRLMILVDDLAKLPSFCGIIEECKSYRAKEK